MTDKLNARAVGEECGMCNYRHVTYCYHENSNHYGHIVASFHPSCLYYKERGHGKNEEASGEKVEGIFAKEEGTQGTGTAAKGG